MSLGTPAEGAEPSSNDTSFPIVRRGFDPGAVRERVSALAIERARLSESLRLSETRVAELEAIIENPTVNMERVAEIFGRQAAEILKSAHDAATAIRVKAEMAARERTAKVEREALEREEQSRSHAESRLMEASESSHHIVAVAREQAQEIITVAEAAAVDLVERAKAEGRSLLGKAREMRTSLVNEMQDRLDALQHEIDEKEMVRTAVQHLIRSARGLIDDADALVSTSEVELTHSLVTVDEVDVSTVLTPMEEAGEVIPVADDVEDAADDPAADTTTSFSVLHDADGISGAEAIRIIGVLRHGEKAAVEPEFKVREDISDDRGTGDEGAWSSPEGTAGVAVESDADDGGARLDDPSVESGEVVASVAGAGIGDTSVIDLADGSGESVDAIAERTHSFDQESSGVDERLVKLEGLFERLRSGGSPPGASLSDGTERREGDLTSGAVATVPGSTSPDADLEGVSDPEAGESEIRVVETPAAELERSDADTLLLRKKLLHATEASLVRRMKRVLQDYQNDLLDTLRKEGNQSAIRRARHLMGEAPGASSDILPYIVEAAQAGRSLLVELGVADHEDSALSGQIEKELGRIGASMLESLAAATLARITLMETSSNGLDDSDGSSFIGSVFREVRGAVVDEVVGDFVNSAFNLGIHSATGAVGFRWVTSDLGANCPDCDDNVLAGPTSPKELFPTGHLYPPVHRGCRCLIIPVVA